MADKTRVEMIDFVLEHLGVKPAGASASAADAALVGAILDSAHERLRKFGLVPFATSAVPPWAQVPLRDFVAGDSAVSFGLRDPKWKQEGKVGERELARQVSGYNHNVPTPGVFF